MNMPAFQKKFSSLLIGVYVWIITIAFGMVLLDSLYANLVPAAHTTSSEVSDFLLLIDFGVLLAALAAIAAAWKIVTARGLLFASLLAFTFEFLIPVLVSVFVKDAQGLTIGPWLRIIPSGAASILALFGMVQYNLQNNNQTTTEKP
jgi:hypothetical protein